MGKLDGKVAIVTGASRGLGKDIAVSLAREGARVVVTARTEKKGDSRIPGTLERTVELVQEVGGQAIAVRCDVTRDDEIEAAVEEAVAEFGQLDILVNNAGIQTPGSTMEMQPRHFDLSYRVNVRGPYVFCRAAVPHMLRVGEGHIVNISSSGIAKGPGEGPYEGPAASGGGGTTYGVSKAALERFTQGLAAELFQQNISVNALSPSRPEWTEGGHFFRAVVAGGDPSYSGWRLSGEIIGDATATICGKAPKADRKSVV